MKKEETSCSFTDKLMEFIDEALDEYIQKDEKYITLKLYKNIMDMQHEIMERVRDENIDVEEFLTKVEGMHIGFLNSLPPKKEAEFIQIDARHISICEKELEYPNEDGDVDIVVSVPKKVAEELMEKADKGHKLITNCGWVGIYIE